MTVSMLDLFNDAVEAQQDAEISSAYKLLPAGRHNLTVVSGKVNIVDDSEKTFNAAMKSLAEGKPFGAAAVVGASDCVNYKQACSTYANYSYEFELASPLIEEQYGTPKIKRKVDIFLTLKWNKVRKGGENYLVPEIDVDRNIVLGQLLKAFDTTEKLPAYHIGMTASVSVTHKARGDDKSKLSENYGDYQGVVEF